MTKIALLLLLTVLVWTGPAASQACRAIAAQGQPPYFAENYPLPLSLRVNLIFLMKEEMAARREYDASLSSAVFTTLLESQIKQAQARLALQLHFLPTSESMSFHESEVMDGRCISRGDA